MDTNHRDQWLTIEKDFQNLSLEELRLQRSGLSSRIDHLQNEVSNLAFNNYRTYADVGRTAEHCKEMFTEMNHFMGQVKKQFPGLVDAMEKFHTTSSTLTGEFSTLDEVSSANSQVWELLKLPKMMDKCIRAGKYEFAFALTNFAVNLKQSRLIENPMIKNVADILVEARHGLLDELFNKFAGPIDLAKSIQVVNNIRKIPYISNTQLRVSILQYRDVYLEKNVLGIMSEPDFVLKVIEVYRDCMYDTIVLYMAVFPGTDFQRKYTSMTDDPRWERWTGSSQTFLLQAWAHRNIERLFGFIRQAENKTALDIEAMTGKLMSFAFSFGRMGLDFRPLIVHEFSQIVVDGFRKKIGVAADSIKSLKKLSLIDSDIFENTKSDLESAASDILSAPLELCVWDDLCVFGNQIIEALNDIRHSLSIIYLNQIFDVLKSAVAEIFKWLDVFVQENPAQTENVKRAAKLVLVYFVPFMNKCFFGCFPYDHCCRPMFRGHATFEGYKDTYSLLSPELFVSCEKQSLFQAVYDEIQQYFQLHQSTNDQTSIESKENDEVKFEIISREDEEEDDDMNHQSENVANQSENVADQWENVSNQRGNVATEIPENEPSKSDPEFEEETVTDPGENTVSTEYLEGIEHNIAGDQSVEMEDDLNVYKKND
ncbi:dor1-like family domain-containing protein [Ditylenchus destructor]|nr:dor1-like family domain-containing protein [Ditylenchus destructor]